MMLDGIQTMSFESKLDKEMREASERKEGRCRFDCRTAKENWIEGYFTALKLECADKFYSDVDIRMEAESEWERLKKTTG